MRLPLSLFLVLGLLLAACQSEAPAVTALEAPAFTATGPFMMRLASEPGGFESLSQAERLERVETIGRASGELQQTLYKASTWQEADEAARSAIASIDEAYRSRFEQIAAGRMLHFRLLPGEANAAKQGAIARYTTMLVEHGTPETALIADGLDRLEGYLPEATRRQLAADALAAYEAHAGPTQSPRLPAAAQAERTASLSENERAVERLRAIAG